MISVFRSIFAPPRHLILLVAALWVGLALAERRSERHNIPKEALNNIVYYGIFGYVLGGRLLYALANFSVFSQTPISLFSPNPDLFDPFAALASAVIVTFIYAHRQKLSFWSLLGIHKTASPSGSEFLFFAALMAGTRLFLEAFRGDSTLILGGLRLAQILAWIILTLALFARESLRSVEKVN